MPRDPRKGPQGVGLRRSHADLPRRGLAGGERRGGGEVPSTAPLGAALSPRIRRAPAGKKGGTPRGSPTRRAARRTRPSLRGEPALVELRIRGGPVPHWMQDLSTRWGAGVRLHVCRHTEESPRRLLQLLEINATPATLPEITAFLRERASPGEVSLTQLGPHRLLVRIVGPLPAVCHSVFEMGAICMSCPFLPSASVQDSEAREGEWRVLVHRVRDAHPLLASFTTPGNTPASLVRIGSYRGIPRPYGPPGDRGRNRVRVGIL